jgi:predicted amidohydrolase
MKVAGVQMDVTLGEVDVNVARIVEKLRETRRAGAELAVFPECAVSGYCFASADEARPFAQTIPGPATAQIADACKELGGYAVFGMLELVEEKLFNAAVLVGPEGLIGSYRKVHLPFLGADMFTEYGDVPFAVERAGELNVGMNICYDSAFPEASRCLSLLGADLIVLPTNWPSGAECVAAYAINTRAMENGVYYMAINRVGTEAGITFIGSSRIADPGGVTLASGSTDGEEILYADIDIARARMKKVVRVPGVHAIDRIADRRPEMYGLLTKPHNLKRPGRE